MVDTRAIKPEDNQGGTLTAQLSIAEVTTANVSPVPAEAPGVITIEPGTVNEEAVHYKTRDAGAGTISGLTRDYTNLNGGTGILHENGASWEVFQSAFYVANLVDILTEGYLREQQTVARTGDTTFTVVGNVAALYTTDRVIRFNGDNGEVQTIVSSSYSAGTGLTTVTATGVSPNPLTYVEIGIQAKSAAFFQVANVVDEDDMVSDSATKVPTQQSVKAYVDHPRTTTEASSATPTINTDVTDMHTITALAADITSMTTNLSGTPVNGQKLIIRIKDDGTARAITHGASFASRGATLLTTTISGKYIYEGFIWNSTTSTFDLVAVTTES